MRRKFCPVSKAFYESTPVGWCRLTDAPTWALDEQAFLLRFVETWQKSDDSLSFWSEFYWLKWSQIADFALAVNKQLEALGLSSLKEKALPKITVAFAENTVDALVHDGVLARNIPKEISELEEYDAVAAMWSAQPQSYDPLNPKHISVGEAGSLRFRVKR